VNTNFFRFVTNHAFDRQTDGRMDRQTAFSWLVRAGIAFSAVRIVPYLKQDVQHLVKLWYRSYDIWKKNCPVFSPPCTTKLPIRRDISHQNISHAHGGLQKS